MAYVQDINIGLKTTGSYTYLVPIAKYDQSNDKFPVGPACLVSFGILMCRQSNYDLFASIDGKYGHWMSDME